MRFQHVEYLFLLAAIPVLLLLFLTLIHWKKGISQKMGDPGLIRQLIRSYSPAKFTIKFSLALLALAAIVIGAANLRKKGSSDNINRQGVDVMFLLDVSKSMLAADERPTRLEKAKQLLTKLMEALPDDRVGLILFAGRAYMQMPLTIDQRAAKMYIQDAAPDIVPTQGTVISDALRMANGSFNTKEHKYKAVVLVSDGEDHDPDGLRTAKMMADNGVMINTVGIGSVEGAPIIDPLTHESKKDENGVPVITRLNEAELSQIAAATNGIYIHLDNIESALNALTQRLDSIEKKAVADSEFADYRNYYPWFLASALLLLLIDFFLSERKFRFS
jgi:Ca-activated chloride channel family protein